MTPDHISVEPSKDSRTMAALAHAGIVIPLWGLICTIIIWITQREKSRFIRFQALQAIVYHIVGMALSTLLGTLTLFIGFIWFSSSPMAFTDFDHTTALGPGEFFPPFLSPLVYIGVTIWSLQILYAIYGIVGAIQALRGRDFRYILIGPWLERHIANG
jgi:uncharacterized Tic20 family protein